MIAGNPHVRPEPTGVVADDLVEEVVENLARLITPVIKETLNNSQKLAKRRKMWYNKSYTLTVESSTQASFTVMY